MASGSPTTVNLKRRETFTIRRLPVIDGTDANNAAGNQREASPRSSSPAWAHSQTIDENCDPARDKFVKKNRRSTAPSPQAPSYIVKERRTKDGDKIVIKLPVVSVDDDQIGGQSSRRMEQKVEPQSFSSPIQRMRTRTFLPRSGSRGSSVSSPSSSQLKTCHVNLTEVKSSKLKQQPSQESHKFKVRPLVHAPCSRVTRPVEFSEGFVNRQKEWMDRKLQRVRAPTPPSQ